MRYICLTHFDPADLDSLPILAKQDVDRRALALNDDLERSGHLVLTEAVEGGGSAVLVRVREGRISRTDGPYIETKEQMAGFVLIDARDLNEAIAIAGRDPLAEIGTIEIRPVRISQAPP